MEDIAPTYFFNVFDFVCVLGDDCTEFWKMSEGWPNTATLSVLTFNCWGIPFPFACKDYNARMDAISKALFGSTRFDVICLQEIWGQNLFEKLQEDAKKLFPYSHYFYSGVLGSGICVFSRWPIVEALFHKWQVNGYVHKITHGDWYGGKGIGLCRLYVKGFRVNVYTCHTHAEYSNKKEYIAHKVVQSFDVAQFIHVSSRDADLAVLAADLNSEPGDLCYRIITNYAGLKDSFQAGNVDDEISYDGSSNNAYFNRVKYEATFGCPSNSYYRMSVSKDQPNGVRIDYILFRGGQNVKVICRSYSTPLEDRVPNQNFSYSDHEAICAVFDLSTMDAAGDYSANRRMTITKKPAEECINDAYNICVQAEKDLRRDIMLTKWFSFLVVIFLLIVFYFVNQFFASVVGLIFLVVAVCMLAFIILFAIYLWKSIERNGILCASKEMKICLDNIQLD